MSISGKQTINIGLPNEPVGSDSLYTAFTKTQDNFDTLFANASPYNTFTGNSGIGVTSNASTGTVTITNTGVTNIVAGTNIIVSGSNGNVTISSTGGGNGGGGTVTSVGVQPVSTNRLTVSGSPIVSSGNMLVDLATSGVTPGTYTNPSVTVDAYGRVTTAASGAPSGTVTSVGLTAGSGIQINGGPVTSSGAITVTNTGVVRLNAGTGIALSSGNGNVTISTAGLGGTVTSVGISTTNQLVITGGPVVTSGTINIDLPSNVTFSGNVNSGNVVTGIVDSSNLKASGTLVLSGSEDLAPSAAANLLVTASYFSTSGAETATLAAGTNGQIKTFMMVADGGDMVITVTNAAWGGAGTITFNNVGEGCILQYIASKWFCIGNNGATFS